MTRLALLLLLAASPAWGQRPYRGSGPGPVSPAERGPDGGAGRAVVRLTSHGASAVCVFTEPGRSLLLGVSHCFEGRDRNKPIVLDVPAGPDGGGAAKRVQIRLVAVDYWADLSLIELNDGPLPYSAAVPGSSYQHGRLYSIGYDQMRSLVVRPATRLTTLYTRERPVPGRSGGGLIDERGALCGVVQGYEVTPWRNGNGSAAGRGMYVDLPTIQRFLARNGWRQETVRQGQPAPRAELPSLGYPEQPRSPPIINPVPPVQGRGDRGFPQREGSTPQTPRPCPT